MQQTGGLHKGELRKGDKAPDFELPDADMTIANLAEYQGKPLVLFFYVRDDTPGCTTEAIEFSDLEGEFARRDCAVVGVSRDDCIRHGAFRDKHGITVRLLADKDGIACQAYGVLVNREVDGVMREGVSRSTFIIDRGGVIRHVLIGVTPKGHAAEVLKLVKEL
jgi:peroxiredoxin Q/BCP